MTIDEMKRDYPAFCDTCTCRCSGEKARRWCYVTQPNGQCIWSREKFTEYVQEHKIETGGKK